MKASGITRTAILSLLLGSVVLACAAQDRPSEDKDHPKQDNKHQQAKPDEHAQQPRPSAREERPAPRQEEPARQQKPANDSSQRAPQARQQQSPPVSREQEHTRQQRGAATPQQNHAQQHVEQAAWQQHRAGNWQSDHRTWQQRGGYTATAFRMPAFAVISDRTMDSESRACPSWWSTGIRASSMAVTG